MDKKDYLNSLKSTELRPGKVKIRERKEEILMEDQYQSRGESDLQAQIIKWFLKNPKPKDEAVHKFAETLGIDPDEFESEIYAVLSSILTEGFSKGKDIDPDSDELKMGIEVEYEHTTSPLISRKIAMDHLVETPDYYTRLKRMEEDADDYWATRKDQRTQK
jgi:Protein of unknown function (DUF5661)